MQKNYPVIYNQNNYGAVNLGNSNTDTIQSGGCFDCSFAMKASFYGHPLDPININKLFVDNKVYMEIDLLPDDALARVFPDIHYIQTINYEPIPTDLNHIKDLLNDPATTLTIRINFGNNNFHFVEAVACDGFTLHIANPISGQLEDFQKRYGNPVTANLHVLVYTGPVPQSQTTPEQPDQTQPSPLAQRFTQAIQKSTNFDTVADYLGLGSDQRITKEAGQAAVDKYKFLQQEVQDLHRQLDDATKQQGAFSTTPAPVLADAPAMAPKTDQAAVAFSDGTSPIIGTQAATATKNKNGKLSPLPQSGPVTPIEFAKAIFRLLFL